jgi:type IV secretion system protein VirB5
MCPSAKGGLLMGAVVVGVIAPSGTPARAQGIPVIDFSAIAQEVQQYALQSKSWVTQNMQWALQAQQYAVQGQQYLTEAEQYLAFVHNPSLGAAMGLLNSAGLGNALPVNPNSMMALVNGFNSGGGSFNLGQISGILGSLSGLAGQSYNANHVYTPTDGSWASQQLVANGDGLAGTQGAALAAYQTLQTHAAALQGLRDHLATATTPKDVQDTQAQIALETTWTDNTNGQLAALQVLAQTQQAERVQRDNEASDRDWDQFLSAAHAAGDTFN